MGAVVVERQVECRVAPHELWRRITDTEQINRAIGTAPIRFSESEDAGAARYLARTVLGGFRVEYYEKPWEWDEDKRFVIQRDFRKGPAEHLTFSYELEETDAGGTRLTVRIQVKPKIGLLKPFIKWQLSRGVRRVAEVVSQVDQELAGGGRGDFPHAVPRVNTAAVRRARELLLEQIGDEHRELAGRLVEHLETASDVDAGRLRPFELADQWEVDRQALLCLCLEAVGAGLLELRWGVVCPSCRVPSAVVTALAELEEHSSCHMCDLSYDVELDRAVEATFRVAPAVRRIDEQTYCSGGPARTPHVVAQHILAPESAIELEAPAEPGRYRLFARGGAVSTVEIEEAGPDSAEAMLDAGQLRPRSLALRGGGKIRIQQGEGSERHVKLEHLRWASNAATAHTISLMPEFRSLFGSEALRAGVSLKVGRVALLFTDLTDSTSLYSTLGDARAYRLIQEHFDALRAVVQSESGVIVKTIGDAVMAAFLDEDAAMRAAIAMHRAYAEFRRGREDAAGTRLKIGVYAGPCYAITANENFDYFGQTVNIAARLQAKARGGEVVTTAELAEGALRRGWLDEASVAERFEASLKGVESLVEAARIAVDMIESE